MKSSRLFVLNLLIRMNDSAYSNIVLDKALMESELTLQDKKFAGSLFYGILERELTLDYIISCYSSKSIEKLDNYILQILRIGIYQLLYMPSVPDNAAVNESVKLVKVIRKSSASGYVNAVLRNFIRDGKELKLPENKIKKLSVEYSCPVWLVEKWLREYKEGSISALLKSTVEKPQTNVRVNTLKISINELIEKLAAENIKAEINKNISGCLNIDSFGQIEQKDSFQKGYFHVQDLSSQLCCMALSPQKGDVVFDLCAAPGGKSFTLAEMMEDNGEIYSFDLHEKRVGLIITGAKRLGLKCIKASFGNAKIFNNNLPQADKVLCDVPCAGLGVISKKPEIKYKSPKDLIGLPKIQYEILENAAKYLKIGGELVYSTCSLSREENDDVVDKFLNEHSDFSGCDILKDMGSPFGSYKATILPEHYNSDGFFIAKIVRKQ